MAPTDERALLDAVLTRVNPTTIDFKAVAEELGITKNAATKRWNRYVEKLKKNADKPAGAESKNKGKGLAQGA